MARLQPRLIAPVEDQAAILRDAVDVSDVARALEVRSNDLTYVLYRAPELYAYRAFEIPKRNGGTRRIQAPHPTVKILQQKLAMLLDCLYEPTRSAHGYVRGRSIVTNARRHEGKRWVLNVDLENFFPSINFGRVRGVLIRRYGIAAPAATVIAQICTTDNALPQGAPTSPVLSNMICIGLDHDLHRLARSCGAWYTRYADDLTFSTRHQMMPSQLADRDEFTGDAKIGHELEAHITGNGFRVNPRKVWMRPNGRRQRVTGLIVNREVNVPRPHIRRIRAAIHTYDTLGYSEFRRRTNARYSRASKYPGGPRPEASATLRGMIEYLGMVRGSDNPMYKAFRQHFLTLEAQRARRRRS